MSEESLEKYEGIIDEDAASIGKSSGLMVIMNECPKKILDA